LKSFAVGVGLADANPIHSIADVWRADARRRKRDRPEGVTQGFQVSLYKVDPHICAFASNLFSKDDCRAALADEMEPVWPKVPLVSEPASFACRGERLAGTGAGPDRAAIGPTGSTERVRPDADAGEEMALDEPSEFRRSNIDN
jgi:hypothetical protein